MIPVAGFSRSPHDSCIQGDDRIDEISGNHRQNRAVLRSGPIEKRLKSREDRDVVGKHPTHPLRVDHRSAPYPQLHKARQDRVEIIGGTENGDQEVHRPVGQHRPCVTPRLLPPRPRSASGSANT